MAGKKERKHFQDNNSPTLERLSSTPKSTNDRHPAFCFRYTEKGFRFSDGSKDEVNAVASKIEYLSQMPWQDLMFGANRKVLEQIKQNAIHNLPKKTPNDRQFYSSRSEGICRIIGYREAKVFHIVWIDYKGKVYRH